MDLEMDEFLHEPFFEEEIDSRYEFDAPKYHDFTRPEIDDNAQDTERWFEISGNYPPSPLIIKLYWGAYIRVEASNCSSTCEAGENINPDRDDLDTSMHSPDDNSIDLKCHTQEIAKAKTKSPLKSPLSNNLSFMNPTASQLAKKKNPLEIHCERLLRRCQNLSVEIEGNSLRSSSVIGTHATKRQKLEAGYLRKVAHLKHQALFLHKAPKKVTIPREPNLETAYRAERHRSKANSVENAKSNACTFKARPLNRKILEAPSLTLPKKSTPKLTEFQVFQLRTLERARQHASVSEANIPNSSPISQNEITNSKRVKSVPALKEKLGTLDNTKDRSLNKKEFNFPADGRFTNELPIESFSKLCLTSEVHSNAKSHSKMSRHSKVSKENAPSSPQLEHEVY